MEPKNCSNSRSVSSPCFMLSLPSNACCALFLKSLRRDCSAWVAACSMAAFCCRRFLEARSSILASAAALTCFFFCCNSWCLAACEGLHHSWDWVNHVITSTPCPSRVRLAGVLHTCNPTACYIHATPRHAYYTRLACRPANQCLGMRTSMPSASPFANALSVI